MSSDLAVVICHGNYLTPAPYQPLIDALKARGIDAYCPQLATSDLSKLNVGNVNHPNYDLGPPPEGFPQGEQDAEIVLRVLTPLIKEQGKKVLILAHSAGGWTATQAAIPELQEKTRKEKGLSGGIIGIFYFGAFIIPVGESIHSFFQPKNAPPQTPAWLRFYKNGPDGVGTLVHPEEFLFNDLGAEDAAKWTATLTASPVNKTVLTNDAYSVLPCAYLVLDGDAILPKVYQEGMAAVQGQKTGEFKMYHCPAGHSPHLSWTEGMVDTVQDFVGSLSK